MNTIYRGFNIDKEGGELPYKVSRDGIKVWAGRSEDEAMAFVDRTKREEAQATKKGAAS
jgi:hypothetical protein